jgi:hypothetical protein
MLPNSFYSKHVNAWDEPVDPDVAHFQERREELIRAYDLIDERAPAISCVAELKHARAWLSCLSQHRVA